jgi:hypothetical protein
VKQAIQIQGKSLLSICQFYDAWFRQQAAERRVWLGGLVKRRKEGLPLLGRKRKFLLFGQFKLRDSTGALHNEFRHGLPLTTRAPAQERLFGIGDSSVYPP